MAQPGERVLEQLAERWPRLEPAVVSAAEARSSERLRTLLRGLERKAEREADDLQAVLAELERAILSELSAPPPTQLDLFSKDEKTQRDRDTTALRYRLESLPEEIADERAAVISRYANPTPRTFPVAITFYIPESMQEGLA